MTSKLQNLHVFCQRTVKKDKLNWFKKNDLWSSIKANREKGSYKKQRDSVAVDWKTVNKPRVMNGICCQQLFLGKRMGSSQASNHCERHAHIKKRTW